MNTNLSRMLVFVLAIMTSVACNAWRGYDRGYDRGYYNDGGYYRGGGWGGGWSGVTIGTPVGGYGASYYGPACYKQRVCSYNGCWIQRRCY